MKGLARGATLLAPLRSARGGGVVPVPGVRVLDAFSQADPRLPAEALEPAAVHELAGRAVGLAGVEGEVSFVADDVLDRLGELADGDVGAGADVDRSGKRDVFEQEQARVGEVVGVEELAPRRAGTPDGHGGAAVHLRLVRLADQRG